MQKPCPIVSAELSRRALSKRRLLPLEAAYDTKRKSCGKIFCLRQPPDLWGNWLITIGSAVAVILAPNMKDGSKRSEFDKINASKVYFHGKLDRRDHLKGVTDCSTPKT
jgi:hypothetical protein